MATSTTNASGFSPKLHAQVSDNFRLLSAAASKAQEAASRYEKQTTNLLTARSLLSRRDVADTPVMDRDSYLPSNASSIRSDISESHQVNNKDGNIQDRSKRNRDEVQSLNHLKPSDSVLENASSESKDCIGQSEVDALTSLSDAKIPRNGQALTNKMVFDFHLDKNSNLVPSEGNGTPQTPASQALSAPPGHTTPISQEGGRVRRSLSESSAPPIRDCAIQIPYQKIPKHVAEWINGGKAAGSEREATSHANLIYESTGPKETSKPQSSQSQPPTPLKTTRVASGTSRRSSHTLSTPPSIPGVGETTSRPAVDFYTQNISPSITARLNTLPTSLTHDLAFIQVFKELVYPCIKASSQVYRGRVSEDILSSISKDVSNQVVTENFRNFVRECSYNLDDEQRKNIRELIKSSFRKKALLAIASAGVTLANGSNDSSKKTEKIMFDTSVGLSRTFSTRFPIQTLTLPGLSSSYPPLSASSSTVINGITSGGNLANLIDGPERVLPDSSTATKSSRSLIGHAVTSELVTAGEPRTVPFSPKNNLNNVSKHLAPAEAEASSNTDISVSFSTVMHVSEGIKSSNSPIDSQPLASTLASTSSSEFEFQGYQSNQQVMSVENGEAAKKIPDLGEVRRKVKHGGNGLVNIARPPPNAVKPLSVDPEFQSDHDKTKVLIHSPSGGVSSEEDGDHVLASWMKVKPRKERSDQSMSSGKDKLGSPKMGFFSTRLSKKTRPIAKIHSFSPTSVQADLRSDQTSDTEDPLTTLPTPQQRNLHGFASRTSHSRLSTSVSSTFPYEGVVDSALPEVLSSNDIADIAAPEAEKYIRMKGTDRSVPPPRDDLLRQSKGFFRHGESRKQVSQSDNGPSHRHRQTSQSSRGVAQSVMGGLSQKYDPHLTKTLAELALHQPLLRRPYANEKCESSRAPEKSNELKHVDFSEEECEELLQAWLMFDSPHESHHKSELGPKFRTDLQESLQLLSPPEIAGFVKSLRVSSDSILQGRSRRDIKAFLMDLVEGVVPSHPKFVRAVIEEIDPCHHPLRSTASLLRQRELGIGSGRRFRDLKTELQLRTSQSISPWRSWKGASGDVVACAWAPDSVTYAVGAAAPANEEDLQYNRPRNLLLGDLISNSLEELPDHRVDRPRPETISRGPNSSQAVYDACDPMVYMTVSSLRFSGDGSRLYTASHDKTVKIWDVSSRETRCLKTLEHDALVSDLDVSSFFPGVFAAATQTMDDSIHIYFPESDDPSNSEISSVRFHSPRAKTRPNVEVYPECLRWGRTLNTSQLLLAGFQQWGANYDRHNQGGEICLWNVHAGESLKVKPGSQSVFTATWHPTLDLFATGGSPRRNQDLTHPNSTRSVVRTWDVRYLSHYTVEYECPAIDMQDVTFNPLYPNIVTAGCTDAATYVWDFRKPDNYLQKLQHGRPLLDWDHTRPQEEGDPGVMMTVWGHEGALLYTGSSDGIVKCWDVMRAPEDAHIRDVGNLGAGVQSGAFSPDFSHLLVGDSDGGVHILSSAPVDTWADLLDEGRAQPIEFMKARDATEKAKAEDEVGSEGIQAAKQLLAYGRLVLDPRLGVVQGPRYEGPYAKHARIQAEDPSRLLPEFDALQPFSRRGHERTCISRTRQDLLEERRQLIAEGMAAEEGRGGEFGVVKHEGDIEELDELAAWPSSRSTRKRPREDDSSSSLPRKQPKWAIIDLCTPPPGEEEIRGRSSSVSPSGSRPYSSDVGVDNEIPESEMLEENHWWPRMDEEVFMKLKISG